MTMDRPDDGVTLPLRRGQPSSCILDGTATLSVPRFGEHLNRRDEVIGGYRIVREVGVGGMGVVYEALDQRLKRRAAIKMIRGGTRVSGEAVRRFQTEAEAVAQAHHPNIVQIYDVGFHDGQPYVALEYLAGGSLYAKAANKPQPPLEAAALVRTLADALQKAHASGVIHRDLKPANVMFTEDGVPKITDFGAARLTQEATDGPLTQVGEVIGTPQYMAPEQARGTPDAITPAVDVYALGALLYHLLTGRPPHDGPDAFEVMHAAVHTEPVTPRHLVPAVPRDLETICLKALEKEPGRRYGGAGDMAADLARFLAGESIHAKPDTFRGRLWKKAKRKPVVAGLAVGIVVVALVGLVGVAWQWQVALRNAAIAISLRETAEANEQKALLRGRETDAALITAHEQEMKARHEAEVKERNLYNGTVRGIALMLESGDYRKGYQLLQDSARLAPGQADLRHWEWHHLNRLGNNYLWRTEIGDEAKPMDGLWPHNFALSPDGRTLLVSAGNAYVKSHYDALMPAQWFFLDAASGVVKQLLPDALPQSASEVVWRDAETIVAATPDACTRVIHYPSGRILHEWQAAADAHKSTHISPDGRYAWHCSRFDTVCLRDTVSGAVVHEWRLPSTVRTLLKTTQRMPHWRLVAGTDEGTHVIDPDIDEPLFIPGHYPHRAAVSADGEYLGLHHSPEDGKPGFLSVWSLTGHRPLWSVDRAIMTDASRLEFAPNSDLLGEVFNAGNHVKLHDVHKGRMVCELRGHTNRIWDFRFSPDGRRIASASNDGSVRVWSVETHHETARYRTHTTGVRAVAFDPNGWRLYSGGMDSHAIAWDLTRERTDGSRLPRFEPHGRTDGGAMAGGVWFGADGYARFLDTTLARMIVFDPATYTPQRMVTFEDLGSRWEKVATDYAMDPQARYLFGMGPGRQACLWDGNTGVLLRRWTEFRGNTNGAAISDDGLYVAANIIHRDDETKVFTREFFVARTADGKVLHRLTLPGYSYTGLAFDRKRPILYCGITSVESRVSGLHHFHLDSGKIDVTPMAWPTTIRHVVVSPDNETVAGINYSGNDAGPSVFAFKSRNSGEGWNETAFGPATGLAFTPDSRRLACARFDDCLMIFDTATGHECFSKFVPSSREGDYAFPARVAFSPDNLSLVMNHSNGEVSVWRTDDWQAPRDAQLRERRQEADRAAYAFHLRGAAACRETGNRSGWRFHERWLEKLPAPNDYLKQEWNALRRTPTPPVRKNDGR